MWASAQARRAVSPASTPAGIAETQPWHGVAAARDRQAEREPSPGGRSEAAGAQVHRACSASPFASAGEQEQERWAHSLTDPGVILQRPPPPLLHIPGSASVPPYKEQNLRSLLRQPPPQSSSVGGSVRHSGSGHPGEAQGMPRLGAWLEFSSSLLTQLPANCTLGGSS